MWLARTLFLASLLSGLIHAQGSILLVGGGSENYNDWSDEPYRWFVDHAPNKKILIMHYSTGSTWLPGYFASFGAVSATNLIVSSVSAANDSANYKTIIAADGIFLRGGDQWQYVSRWRGTLVEEAIKEVYQRGGVVGGTSAGEAILSSVIFDARITSVEPRAALRDPLGSGITFTEDFLGLVPGILVDTHFYERGRIGRLLAMIAVYKQQTGKSVTGVGVDYNTALAVSSDGIAEVMGAGTVTLLRMSPSSTYNLRTSTPLRMSNVQMDQLTPGYRLSLTNWNIQTPSSSRPFFAKPVTTVASTVILDGSGSLADWCRPSGSIGRFVSQLQFSDTVGLISSPSSGTTAVSIDSVLKSMNNPSRYLWINDERKNDAEFAFAVKSCNGYVFVGNNADSIAGLLSLSTLAGIALSSGAAAGKPMLLLGNDAKLISDTAVNQTEQHPYAAYYGYLRLGRGLGYLTGVSVMPRLYEYFDYIDNRASGLFWGMGNSNASFGLFLDAGTYATVANNTIQISGLTPALIVDAREVTSFDFPNFCDPGKANPRQNAALVGAIIHVVPDSQSFSLASPTAVLQSKEPFNLSAKSEYLESYPNPFNPSTTIEFNVVREGSTVLRIVDLLGRTVATLVHENLAAGRHTVQWNAAGLAAGSYLAALTTAGRTTIRKLLLVK